MPGIGASGAEDGGSALQDLEKEIGLLLRRGHAAQARLASRVHPDLDAGVYPLLVEIARRDGVRPSELADFFGIGRGTTSRQVARLVEIGLVERFTIPHDNRCHVLRLSADGRARLGEARSRRQAWMAQALEDWPEQDMAELARLLRRLAETVEPRVR